MHTPSRTFLSISAMLLLASCAPSLVAGGAAVGVSANEERSLSTNLSDKMIAANVSKEFAKSDFSKLFMNVNVEVDEGRVMLVGHVDSQKTADEAERIAWFAQGVKEVISHMRVAPSTDLLDSANDAWIASQLRTRLLATKEVNSINYIINVTDGYVYLLGTAQNSYELDSVVQVASRVTGVKKVYSHVRLKNSQQRIKVNNS